jgi:hypothetical protein
MGPNESEAMIPDDAMADPERMVEILMTAQRDDGVRGRSTGMSRLLACADRAISRFPTPPPLDP